MQSINKYDLNCFLFLLLGDQRIYFKQIVGCRISYGYIWGYFDAEGIISSSGELIYASSFHLSINISIKWIKLYFCII